VYAAPILDNTIQKLIFIKILNMNFTQKVVVLFFMFFCACQNNETTQDNSNIKYHQFYESASDYKIRRWNIPQDSLQYFKNYLTELVDDKGRVIELRFGQPALCGLPSIVKYTYPDDNTIIETLYEEDSSKINALYCEAYYKTTYDLDEQKFIKKAQVEFFTDVDAAKQSGLSTDDIKIEMDFINKNTHDSLFNADAAHYVLYYLNSYAKYNKKFPISKDFKGYKDLNVQ
jgi:hypothetical protein